MIIFVTAYDEATEANLAVARLLTNSNQQIFAQHATRDALWQALMQSGNASIFAMSHGRRQFLRAHLGNAPHALMLGDERALGLRRVFAWACLTSADLGVAAAKEGVIWFGFPVKIAAPSNNPRLQSMLAHVLQIVINGLDGVHDETTCRALLDQLVEYANNALLKIDILLESNELPESEYDSVVQQCFEQFQLRLEAWLPGYSEPVRPTRAPKLRYDDLDLDPVRGDLVLLKQIV